MKLVVGLGNPGPKYETTRHNVGFLAVDRLIDKWRATGPTEKNQGELYQATVRGEKVLLIKPQTYMNSSGKCVGPLYQFYKCSPGDVIVIHDEVDLLPLILRLKTGGGTGGHNGLKSIDQHLGNENTQYHRIRIGVAKPALLPEAPPMSTSDWVLAPFSNEELQKLDPLLDRVAEAVERIIDGDMRGAMNDFNRRD